MGRGGVDDSRDSHERAFIADRLEQYDMVALRLLRAVRVIQETLATLMSRHNYLDIHRCCRPIWCHYCILGWIMLAQRAWSSFDSIMLRLSHSRRIDLLWTARRSGLLSAESPSVPLPTTNAAA